MAATSKSVRSSGPEERTTSTRPDEAPIERVRRARTLRRLGVTLLVALLLVGISGFAGVREGEVSASGGGYDLTVRYPRVTRPGLAVPLSILVRHDGGFDGPITVAITDELFTIFDENGVSPAPDAETSDGGRIIWEFEPPDEGSVFEVLIDTRTGPNVQRGMQATTALLDEDGKVAVSVDHRTTVFP